MTKKTNGTAPPPDDRLTDGECKALQAEIREGGLRAAAKQYLVAPGTLARAAAGWRARRATVDVVRRRLAAARKGP